VDDIGIIGSQGGKSAASKKYHNKKTGKIFRRERATAKKSSL
jgi:hypothetical protein